MNVATSTIMVSTNASITREVRGATSESAAAAAAACVVVAKVAMLGGSTAVLPTVPIDGGEVTLEPGPGSDSVVTKVSGTGDGG